MNDDFDIGFCFEHCIDKNDAIIMLGNEFDEFRLARVTDSSVKLCSFHLIFKDPTKVAEFVHSVYEYKQAKISGLSDEKEHEAKILDLLRRYAIVEVEKNDVFKAEKDDVLKRKCIYYPELVMNQWNEEE